MVIFKISDGTKNGTIDLMQPGVKIGLPAGAWRPAAPSIEATYQSSPLTDGSDVSSYKFKNATEQIEFKAIGYCQDDVIEIVQDLRRLLISGIDYQVVNWHSLPVYLIAKAKDETNTRYALVKMFTLPDDDNPFDEPFINKKSIMDNMLVTLERGNWLALPPGTGEFQEANTLQIWEYNKTWTVNLSGAPLSGSNVWDFLQVSANSHILAATDAGMLRTTDNGATWGLVAGGLPASFDYSLLETISGDLYVGLTPYVPGSNNEIYKSTDDGATWAVTTFSNPGFSKTVLALTQANNGNIVVGSEDGDIHYSNDDGATWNLAQTLDSAVSRLITLSTGTLLAAAAQIYRSTDNGLTWSLVLFGFAIVDFIELADDVILAAGTNFYGSTDDGISWTFYSAGIPTAGTHRFIQLSNGDLLSGGYFNQIYRSTDLGLHWILEYSTGDADEDTYALLEAANGDIYADISNLVLSAEILKLSTGTVVMGRTSSDNDGGVFISNKSAKSNLTHIKIDDGGVFSDIFPITVFPADLLPAVPIVGDALCFGSSTSVQDGGPFSGLVFNIAEVIMASSTYAFTWEYYNGGWAALTVTDGTKSGTGGTFTTLGISSVHWVVPTDWTTVTIDGVTGYWIRVRLSALAGTVTQVPTQQSDQIYTIPNPYFQINSDVIGGDLPALAQFKILNRSDADGKAGSAPNLWSNRIIAGLRSLSRGSGFDAFINISDQQQLAGITVTAGTNASFGNDVTTPTGRRLTYAAAIGDTTFVTRATITFATSIVQNFYGTFHLFLRGKQASGSSGDITVQIQIKTSSGGITYTTPKAVFQGTNDWELLDFDAITIPAGGRSIKLSDLGDEGTITIQAKNSSGATRNVYFYDLIFIPTDEWAGDFTDKANINDSIIGGQNSLRHFIDLDSVTNPKVIGVSTVRQNDTYGKISAIYEYGANGQVMLQANANQRLWVLSAHYGSNDEWLSEPWVAWSVEVLKNQQYLSMRGSR